MRIVDRLAEARRRERGEKTGGMKTEKISDGEGVTDREALVQSREHGLKCQLCAGETPGGEHTGSAAESHTHVRARANIFARARMRGGCQVTLAAQRFICKRVAGLHIWF